MAIAYDSTASSSTNSTNTGITFSHTCSGTNRLLIVSVSTLASGNITGVTYNGSAMTSITSRTGSYGKSYLFYLIAPSTGANTVSVSVSGGFQPVAACSTSYTGASQITQPDASVSAASYTTSLTVVNSNCWIVGTTGFAQAQGTMTFNAGSGFTLRNSTTASYQACNGLQDSNGSVSTGSNTVAMSLTGGWNPDTIIAASINPYITDRYWVGGSGTWDNSTATHWSYTSGGSGGVAAPTLIDDVHLDANSGSVTVTQSDGSGGVNCHSLDCTGFTGTLTNTSSNGSMSIYGSLTLVSSMTYTRVGGPGWTFRSPSTGTTLTTAGNTLPTTVLTGGGEYTLLDDANFASNGILLGTCTFNTGNKNINTTRFLSGTGGTTLQTINLGSSFITVTSGSSNFNAVGTSVFNCGTSTFKFTGTSTGNQFGGRTFYTFQVSGNLSANPTSSGDATMNTLIIDAGKTYTTTSTTQTITNLVSNGTSISHAGLTGGTISCSSGIISVNYMTISNNTAAGGATFYAGSNSTNSGGNSGWLFNSYITTSLAVSIINAASRTSTLAWTKDAILSISMMNSVSRLTSLSRIQTLYKSLTDSISNSVSRTVYLSRSLTFAKTCSDSITNATSRFVNIFSLRVALRSLVDTVGNGASRLATLVSIKSLLRTVSDSISNGASRLITTVGISIKNRGVSDYIFISANRLTSVFRSIVYIRAMSDSLINAVSRLTTLSAYRALSRTLSDGIMNGASRLTTLLSKVFSKFRPKVSIISINTLFRTSKPGTTSQMKTQSVDQTTVKVKSITNKIDIIKNNTPKLKI